MNMPRPEDIPQSLKDRVNQYLIAHVIAETLREKVDEACHMAMRLHTVAVAAEWVADGEPQRRLLSRDDLMLASEEDAALIRGAVNELLRSNGTKPTGMPDSYCPAYVADHEAHIRSVAMLNEAGVLLGMGDDFYDQCACSLETLKEAKHLICGLVCLLPDYQKPDVMVINVSEWLIAACA